MVWNCRRTGCPQYIWTYVGDVEEWPFLCVAKKNKSTLDTSESYRWPLSLSLFKKILKHWIIKYELLKHKPTSWSGIDGIHWFLHVYCVYYYSTIRTRRVSSRWII